MRAPVLLAAAAVAGTVAWSGSASAQGMGVYVGPGYGDYYSYGPAPRVRNYYNDDDDGGGVTLGYAPLPYPAGGCGVYRYWNGYRCVDARWRK
jgi:hypothetical protein